MSSVDPTGSAALFSAISVNDIEAVKGMVSHDRALANAKNEAMVSALMFSVYANRTAIRDILLEAGAELLFHESAAVGNAEALKRWLDADIEKLNSFSHDGWAALHLAAFFGHEVVADLLVSLGAEINIVSQNAMRVMPLHSALSTSRWKLARILIQHGADVNAAAGELGLAPLHYAAANGSMELVDLLITLDANPLTEAKDGRTPAHFAFENKHFAVAEFLRGKEHA